MSSPDYSTVAHWPVYQSHKVLRAAVITEITSSSGRVRALVVDPGDGSTESFMPTEYNMAERARVGWYAIVYVDGYKSVSPPDAFLAGNRRVSPEVET